jgi:hypothetical protein
MPSGTATRPGDVVTAMNGKTIQVCTVNIWAYLLYIMNKRYIDGSSDG